MLGAESRLLDAIQAAVGDATPASDLAPQFPDLKKLVVDDAGHMIHFEAPAALARAIESFLGPTL